MILEFQALMSYTDGQKLVDLTTLTLAIMLSNVYHLWGSVCYILLPCLKFV